jgi:hypothetical protein
VKRAIALAAVAVLMAACGSDDEDAGDGGETEAGAPTETAAPAPDTSLLRSDAIGFTFRYPQEMKAETRPRDQVLAQVSVEPGARLNAIKVRRTADRELGPERYLDEFRRDFAKAVGEVEKSEERIGNIETGVLEFEDSVEMEGETVAFTSSSYFFKGAGKTWQIECIADIEHREQIEDACRAALESVEFTRPAKKRAPGRAKQVD